LRPDSPVHRQARIDAARDAMRRAGEYAEAFGGQLGPLLEAADPGLLTGPAGGGSRFGGMESVRAMPMQASSADAPPALDFEPVRQSVSAQIDARFAVLLPDS
jgi:uncharacterized protein